MFRAAIKNNKSTHLQIKVDIFHIFTILRGYKVVGGIGSLFPPDKILILYLGLISSEEKVRIVI